MQTKTECKLSGFDAVITRKKMKNVVFRVGDGGKLLISAPLKLASAKIEELVAARKDELAEAIAQKNALPKHEFLPGETLSLLGVRYPIVFREGKGRCRAELDGGVLVFIGAGDADACCRAFLQLRNACLKQEAERLFALWKEKIGLSPDSVAYREMKTRFGVCRTGQGESRITLNLRLGFYPPVLIEYVILHELTHLRVMGHSERFYAALAGYLPDHAERRRLLHRLERDMRAEFPL